MRDTDIDVQEAKDRLEEQGYAVFECINNYIFIHDQNLPKRFSLSWTNFKLGNPSLGGSVSLVGSLKNHQDMICVGQHFVDNHMQALRTLMDKQKTEYKREHQSKANAIIKLDELTR